MPRIMSPLLLMLAHATHSELIKQIQFLKIENEVLRGKLPKQIRITDAEKKRLIKFGKALGDAIKDLITIVSPRTFARWIAKKAKAGNTGEAQKKPGRPRTKAEVQELILRLARENPRWGYTRILGELKKIEIHSVGRSTIRDLLKEHGIDPEPSEKTWEEFITSHKDTLWACDLLSQKVLTTKGYVEFFLIFFIHIESRLVWASPVSRLGISAFIFKSRGPWGRARSTSSGIAMANSRAAGSIAS